VEWPEVQIIMTNEWLVEQGRIETLDCDCQLLMKMNDPSWLSPETSLILWLCLWRNGMQSRSL